MNKKNRIILASILMLVLAIIVIAQFTTPEYQKENVFRAGKIKEMANYLNAKYASHVTVDDCVYFRKEDYSYHDAFLYGTTYDIPNIAIFDCNGKYITVTDRNGFLADDDLLDLPVNILFRLVIENQLKPICIPEIGHKFADILRRQLFVELMVEYLVQRGILNIAV